MAFLKVLRMRFIAILWLSQVLQRWAITCMISR